MKKQRLGTSLGELLPVDDARSLQSIWSQRRFIPGVVDVEKAEERVFAASSFGEVRDLITKRKLGSPLHYRFYFALSSPRTVIPDADFDQLLRWARDDIVALKERLLHYGSTRRLSGRNWFEHVVQRLDSATVERLDARQCEGFIISIATVIDEILGRNPEVPMSLTTGYSDYRVGRLIAMAGPDEVPRAKIVVAVFAGA